VVLVLTLGVAGCAGLTTQQDAAWVAFHACQAAWPTATLEDLHPNGRVHYVTREASEFSLMRACMERHGYQCDLGPTIGSRPQTRCDPRPS
jgi:hypothetical protein